MGLRTYGTEELMFYVTDLEHGALATVDWGSPAGPLRSCGVEAIVADAVSLPVVRALLPLSPDARLILLARDWRRWRASKTSTLSRGPLSQLLVRAFYVVVLCNWLPVGLVWPSNRAELGASFMRAGGGLTMELLDSCYALGRFRASVQRNPGRAAWFEEMMGNLTSSEEAYAALLEQHRTLVPGDRLLEADISKLGWAELSVFLGLPLPQGLEAAGPLPRAKIGGLGKIIVRMFLHPAKHVALLALLLACMLANWLVFTALWGRFAVPGPSGDQAAVPVTAKRHVD